MFSPTNEKMECVRNSYSPCFFCSETGENNSITRLSLSKLFNYLQLFPRDGKGNKLNYPSDEKFSSVSICHSCSEMAVEFSELYHLLEVTEMRLNRCLDRMQEVMTNNEEVGSLRKAVMGRIMEVSKLPHVQLRNRSPIVIVPSSVYSISEDSNGPLKNSNDLELRSSTHAEEVKVKIECMEEKPVISPSPQPGTGSGRDHIKMKARKRKKSKKDKDKKTGKSTQNDSLNSEQISIATASSSPSTSSNTCKFCNKTFLRSNTARRHMKYNCKEGPRLSPPDSGLKLTCTYCSYECPSSRNVMKDHLIRRHPEMFFQSERNNSSSTSRWKQEHFETVVKEIVIPKFILKNEQSASCSVCGKKCRTKKSFSRNRSVMTVHLINHHIEEVREHIKDIMGESDASLQEKYYLALHDQNLNTSRSSKEDTLMDVDESTTDDDHEDSE